MKKSLILSSILVSLTTFSSNGEILNINPLTADEFIYKGAHYKSIPEQMKNDGGVYFSTNGEEIHFNNALTLEDGYFSIHVEGKFKENQVSDFAYKRIVLEDSNQKTVYQIPLSSCNKNFCFTPDFKLNKEDIDKITGFYIESGDHNTETPYTIKGITIQNIQFPDSSLTYDENGFRFRLRPDYAFTYDYKAIKDGKEYPIDYQIDVACRKKLGYGYISPRDIMEFDNYPELASVSNSSFHNAIKFFSNSLAAKEFIKDHYSFTLNKFNGQEFYLYGLNSPNLLNYVDNKSSQYNSKIVKASNFFVENSVRPYVIPICVKRLNSPDFPE